MSATNLKTLRAQIEALPVQQARASIVERLKRFVDRATAAQERLVTAGTGEAVVTRVFVESEAPDGLPKVRDATSRAARAAKRLNRTLSARIEDVERTKSEKDLEDLYESAEAARGHARDAWKEHFERRVSALKPLAEVALAAGLHSASDLVQRLNALGRTPPATLGAADGVRAEFEAIGTAVAALGMEGEAWKFASAAVKGQAPARALENPEVRAFVDRHQLWDRLRVKLG